MAALPVGEQVITYVPVGGETRVKLPTDDQGKPWGRTAIGITEPGQPQMVFQLDGDGTVRVPANRLARFLAVVAGSSPA
jgi:hypothetical protein